MNPSTVSLVSERGEVVLSCKERHCEGHSSHCCLSSICHTALTIGGTISWLNIYPDGSGLANTLIPIGAFQRALVACAGYQGTAVAGGIMLMFRRTNLGARVGTCGMGLAMLLTCIFFVGNAFGLVSLLLMGILLLAAGWRLSSFSSVWMVLAFWMTAMGVFITFETKVNDSREVSREDRVDLLLTTELV